MTNHSRQRQRRRTARPAGRAGRWRTVLLVASISVLAIAGGTLALAMVATLADQGTLDGRVSGPWQVLAQTVAGTGADSNPRLGAAPKAQPARF